MYRHLFILGFIVLFSSVVAAGESVACTEEAKVCPDGSAVGRTGPDCAFAPCPEEAAPLDIEEHMEGSPEEEGAPERDPEED
jgi:hypothetical protein